MSSFKTRAVWLLAAAASAASALGGYQQYQSFTSKPATAAPAVSTAPASRVKTGALASISAALRHELESLAPQQTTGVFVHFTDAALPQRQALLALHGLTSVNDFQPWADSVYATGTASAFFAIAAEPGVYFLEQNEKLHYFNHTANWAIRSRFAQERVGDGPYYDASGAVLTGKGVGVAMIDSGADGRHPDFQHALKRNFKALATTGEMFDVGLNASSDTTGGHGVHVAGTIMADGSASTVNYPDAAGTPYIKGSFAGVAPDVSFYAYGAGEAILVSFANQSFQHMLDHYDDRAVFPERVRVINNSWGASGGEYSPTSTQSQLVKQLVAKGVNVVFAAGNSGDATEADTTSPTCKDTTPGVICVASYDDGGTGSRDGVMSGFTSQGPFADPSKYPDVSAPGQDITSTCSTYLPICKNTDPFVPADTAFLPFYGTISGTSMATPHVVGSIALLLQARPDLTPAQVEKLLQDTARKVDDPVYGDSRAAYVADPQNPGTTINYRAGAGLIDLPAALDALGVTKFGSLPALGEYTVISGDANATGGADDGSPSAIGANDLVSLKLIEENKGGVQGLSYQLEVADASDLAGASYVRYQVINNINGKHFTTAVTLTESGVTADGVGAYSSAAATSVKRDGNVIRFFVPLGSLGAPPVGSPVHNLRLVATSDLNGSAAEVDYAPSGDPLLGTSATAPGFGRPYTILTAATPVVENRCEIPGITLLTDAGGDSMTTDSNQDLLGASVAQPLVASGNPNLVFTLKVASLATLTPGSGYFVSFNDPDGLVRGVRMEVLNPGAPGFFTYLAGASGGTPPVSDGRFVDSQSPAAAGSGYDAGSGTITIVATPESLGLSAAGQTLTGFNGGVTQTTDPTNMLAGATLVTDEMPDGLGRLGEFEYKANRFCAPNTPPVAILTTTTVAGSKPLTVNFSGRDSSDEDGIASYTFSAGDGSAPVTRTTPDFTHTYRRSGTFVASLSVQDARGADSTTPGQQTLTVNNDAPVAALSADLTSGPVPLKVNFDAIESSDPNVGDAVVSYSFDLDGDGVFEIIDSDSAKPSTTYTAVGSYVAQVKVKDSEGKESASKALTITATEAGGGTGSGSLSIDSFTATPDRGDVTEKPLEVTFTASATDTDPQAGTVSYTFYYGDGTHSERQASGTSSHRYARAGTYEATVIAADDHGNSATASTTITATTTVTVIPGPVTAALTVSLANGSSEVPATAILDGSGSTSSEGAIYRFSFGDGTADQVGIDKMAQHVYTTAGSFTVTLTVTDRDDASNTATATASVTVTAAQQTVAQLVVSPSTAKVGQPVGFDASASLARTGSRITRYRFDFGDGTVLVQDVPTPDDGKAALATHVYTRTGNFTPSVTVTDDRSATSSAKALVKVGGSTATVPPAGSSPQVPLSPVPKGGALPALTLLPLLALAGLRRRQPR